MSVLASPPYPAAPAASPMSGYTPSPIGVVPTPSPVAAKPSEGAGKSAANPPLRGESENWSKLESDGSKKQTGNPAECMSNPDSGYGSKIYFKGGFSAGGLAVGVGTSFTTAGGPSYPEDAPPVGGRRGVVSAVAWDRGVQPDIVTNWYRTQNRMRPGAETICPDNTPNRNAVQSPLYSAQQRLDDTSALLCHSMPRLDAMPANQKRDLLSLAAQNELFIYRSSAAVPHSQALDGGGNDGKADCNQNRESGGRGGRSQQGTDTVCLPTAGFEAGLACAVTGGRESVNTLVEDVSRTEVGRSTTV